MGEQVFSYVSHLIQKKEILTDRIRNLKEEIRKQPVYGDWERDHLLTEYWRQSDGESIYNRRAKAFDKILSEITIKIFDGELIVGAPNQYGVGSAFYPEVSQEWIEQEWDQFSNREADQFVPVGKREEVLSDCAFWKGKSLTDVVLPMWYAKYGSLMEDMIESRISIDIKPLTQGRQIVDFVKVLNRGIKGVIEEVEEAKEKAAINTSDDLRRFEFWESCSIACRAVIKFSKRHALFAREMARSEKNEIKRRELEEIADICDRVPERPARTFREALQSLWFIHLSVELENNSFGYSLGRMDQYLYPFYRKDLNEGKITNEKAAELLACLWLKLSTLYFLTRGSITALGATSNFQNVTIGGCDGDGRSAVNSLSHLIVEVDTALKLRQPTISLRYHDRVDEDFLFKCGEDIATGGGKPAIFCEKYPYFVLPQYGVPLKDVVEFTPIGCVEFGIPGKTTLFAGYFISLPHCLELVFTNGISRKTGKMIGIKTGDPEELKTFDQFINSFFKQFEFANKVICECDIMQEVAIRPDRTPCPFNSSLVSDCISSGKDIHRGGGRYKQFFAGYPIGMVTTANSLFAVKELIYDKKQITMGELDQALIENYSGNGSKRIKKFCLDAPKYGNDIDEVDSMLRRLFERCTEIVMKEKNAFGYPVVPAYLGITSHYWHGLACGATPDGRMAYTPFADGSLSPYRETDTHGPTSVVKSATKANPSPALSTLFNMKFHPSVFAQMEGMRDFWNLVKTYSDLGGYHIQFNVVSKEVLLDAQKHPEEYRDLLIRVAGFSAYFVELQPLVQDEIIERTEHAL